MKKQITSISPFQTAKIIALLYLIFGFIFTIIGAWVYNLLAKWVGGIEFTTAEIEDS